MATATKKAPGSKRGARDAADGQPGSAMAFLVFEDNGGSYHWRIVAGDGAMLGQSGGFASYRDAEQAADHIRDGAASASFERRSPSSGEPAR